MSDLSDNKSPTQESVSLSRNFGAVYREGSTPTAQTRSSAMNTLTPTPRAAASTGEAPPNLPDEEDPDDPGDTFSLAVQQILTMNKKKKAAEDMYARRRGYYSRAAVAELASRHARQMREVHQVYEERLRHSQDLATLKVRSMSEVERRAVSAGANKGGASSSVVPSNQRGGTILVANRDKGKPASTMIAEEAIKATQKGYGSTLRTKAAGGITARTVTGGQSRSALPAPTAREENNGGAAQVAKGTKSLVPRSRQVSPTAELLNDFVPEVDEDNASGMDELITAMDGAINEYQDDKEARRARLMMNRSPASVKYHLGSANATATSAAANNSNMYRREEGGGAQHPARPVASASLAARAARRVTPSTLKRAPPSAPARRPLTATSSAQRTSIPPQGDAPVVTLDASIPQSSVLIPDKPSAASVLRGLMSTSAKSAVTSHYRPMSARVSRPNSRSTAASATTLGSSSNDRQVVLMRAQAFGVVGSGHTFTERRADLKNKELLAGAAEAGAKRDAKRHNDAWLDQS